MSVQIIVFASMIAAFTAAIIHIIRKDRRDQTTQ